MDSLSDEMSGQQNFLCNILEQWMYCGKHTAGVAQSGTHI